MNQSKSSTAQIAALERIAAKKERESLEELWRKLVAEVQGTLDNTAELGDRIRTRILEEAYDLGRDTLQVRKDKLEVELEGEKLP